jgi:hypothetical protein
MRWRLPYRTAAVISSPGWAGRQCSAIAGGGAVEQGVVDAEGRERRAALGGRRLVAHADPYVGVDGVGAAHRLGGVAISSGACLRLELVARRRCHDHLHPGPRAEQCQRPRDVVAVSHVGDAQPVERAAEAGAVGGSIEDFDPDRGIYAPEHAAERVAAAVETARALDFPFTLTARAENHIRGNPDLDDTIARLKAYERAGADVLYAPGLATLDEIRTVREETTRPLNVLARSRLSMSELADAGAVRGRDGPARAGHAKAG